MPGGRDPAEGEEVRAEAWGPKNKDDTSGATAMLANGITMELLK
jgi:hypothetical protein